MKQQQTSGPSFMDTFALIQWGMKFPAMTLMVITRRNIGYRFLNPFVLIAVFGLLAVVTILLTPGNEAANPGYLLIFAAVGFTVGISQRIRGWCNIMNGVHGHSYSVGISIFDFRWLPHFVRRHRLVARYFEPLFWIGIGFAIFPYSPALGLWLGFAAFCLRGFEDQLVRRIRNRDLDLWDSIIVSEDQSRVLEQYEQAHNPPQAQDSVGIPTGLGKDSPKKFHSAKHQNTSLN